MKKFNTQIKENLDADISSFSHRRLSSILKNPKHPMHSAAKAEHDRRNIKVEGAMKRIATTQSNKADRMGSTDKKGLETFKKFRKKMNEKTLTPAEKKKREEIAKSMERDNPGMDMSKKMAIATAQAKKVAEAKEIDEISIDKLSRYGKAAAKDIEKHRNTVRTALDQPASPKRAKAGLASMQKLTKRSRGSDMYVDKMTGRSKVKPSVSTVGKDKQVTKEERKGLWANIHAKRKRGEKPNPPGHPDRPTAADFKRSQK